MLKQENRTKRKEELAQHIIEQEAEIRTLVPVINELNTKVTKLLYRYQELINHNLTDKKELFILEGKLQVIKGRGGSVAGVAKSAPDLTSAVLSAVKGMDDQVKKDLISKLMGG